MGRTKFSTSTALALAAVLLSSSTTVYAIAALPKHSVGKKQLKPSAVTNSKIHKGAVSASKVAPKTFVGASRMAFGKGNATDVPAKMLISLPNIHVTVTTDGDADIAAVVVVHLPVLSTSSWFINASDGVQMFSTTGGSTQLGPPIAMVPLNRELTAHIWRVDSSQALYLHCVFDTTGFSTSHPLSCWAFST